MHAGGSLTISGTILVLAATATFPQPPRYGGGEVSLGVSVVGAASDFIGPGQSLHLRAVTGSQIAPRLAAGIRFDAFLMGTVISQPECAIPEQGSLLPPCDARTERAGALLGLSLEARWYPWMNGLGVSAGVGEFYAPSVHGDVASVGAALSGGVEYQLFSGSSGVRPVVGMRGSRLLRDVGGVRWTFSPTVGLRF